MNKRCPRKGCKNPDNAIFSRCSGKPDGLQPWCKLCVKEHRKTPQSRRLQAKRRIKTRDYQKTYMMDNWEQSLMYSAEGCSRQRGHDAPTIDKSWIWEQFKRQDERCFHTGVSMRLGVKSPFQPSLERLDNSIGYTPDNTVLVSWAANSARGDYSLTEFQEWIQSVRCAV